MPSVVHEPAYGRLGIGSDLDEVKVEFASLAEGVGQRDDADCRAVLADKTNFACSDLFVDALVTLIPVAVRD